MNGAPRQVAAPQDAGHARRVRRIIAWSLPALIILLLLTPYFLWTLQPVRQSAVRAMVHARIQSIEQAARQMQRDTGTAPTLDGVLKSGLLTGETLEQFSRAVPNGAADTDLPLVVQTVPSRAVRKGETWGGIEETIDHDLPACRVVLMPDWTVVRIDEPDYQRDIAPRIRLLPLR